MDILKHAIKHTCKKENCNYATHHENTLEIPSAVFLEYTLRVKNKFPNESLPPD